MRIFSQALCANSRTCACVCRIAAIFALVAGFTVSGLAEEKDVKYDFSGYTCFQAGEIVKGNLIFNSINDTLNNIFQGRFMGGFNLKATLKKRLTVEFNPECIITHAVFKEDLSYVLDQESAHSFYFFYLNKMAGSYSFGDPENPVAKVTVGYFPFSYNSSVKSLGEYLFRGTEYPGYIINDFGSVYKRLGGLHVFCKPVSNLKLDFLLNMELMNPVGDFTPSLLGSYSFGGSENRPLLEVGAGISFTRLLSVDPKLTTPHRAQNVSDIENVRPVLDSNNVPIPGATTGDTTFYSFAGTKPMVRFSFDPKPLFGDPDFFGDEDLKLYGEACILGTKNYKGYYDDIYERFPAMIGFDVPTFKLLDFLSVEVEYWWQRYSNNYQNTYWYGTYVMPTPNLASPPKAFPWYWSIFAQKTLTPGLKLMAEATRNHYFTTAKFFYYQDRGESTPSHGDWEYTARVQFEF